MKLITRHTDYAVQALCYLAEHDGTTVTVAEFCEELGMPRAFLRGLLQKLSMHGLLVSSKGRSGGFALARSPGRIALTDVMKVFQGPLEFSKCTFRKHPCPRTKKCALRRALHSIDAVVAEQLSKVSVLSLVEGS